MEKREIAIRISNVKKKYRIGQIGGNTLQEAVQSVGARLLKKEDPNVKLGQTRRLEGKSFMALNGIDLTIYKGEAIGIIGGNGAGKSTMLKLLSRITAPTEGEIDIYGRVASMLEVGTGFNGEMTGRENIYMNGAILGMKKDEIDAKMEQIIEFSEICDFIDTPVKRYSSGMYVKLAFSVAAHLDSEIMIMDEVLAVGDMKFQKKCLEKMRNAANLEGKTVLYVSHNMNTIRQLCSRCIVLEQGKIIYDGDVDLAISNYMEGKGNVALTNYNYFSGDVEELTQKSAKLLWLQLDRKESMVYTSGDNLSFKMAVWSGKNFEHLQFRLELWYADEIPVGTSLGLDLGRMEIQETKEFKVQFDTSQLTRGRYQANLILYEENDFGKSVDYDIILPGFYFEIDDGMKMIWDVKDWGHIKLKEMTCEAI